MAKDIQTVRNTLPQVGQVDRIQLRPDRNTPMLIVEKTEVTVDEGLIGDRYKAKNGKRQVTLIQAEHLEAVAKLLGKDQLDSTLTRRNIVVSGINLLALKGRQFKVGEVELEMTGPCEPCTKMETNFGVGGYNAMRGHGGICARVIKGGIIRQGDAVKWEGKHKSG